jgi:Skp family chaperone for outer membrane proteins
MRKQLSGAALATFALMTTAAAAYRAGEVKIAFVDTAVLQQQAPGRAEAEGQMRAIDGELQKKGKPLRDSGQALQKLAQAEMAKTDTAGRGKRMQVLMSADSALQLKVQELQQQAQQQSQAIVGPIIQNIRNSLDLIREEGGYTAIFDIGQTGGASEVVAWDKNLDITYKVIARMKIEAAKPKPPSKVPVPKSGGGGGLPK